MRWERIIKVMVIGILIGIIIILIAIIVLFATNTLSFGGGVSSSNDDTVKNKEVEKEDSVEDGSKLDNDIYASVIEEYRSAINDKEYESIIDRETKYLSINTNMLHLYHAHGETVLFKYVFYDINNDNKNEMIVGSGVDGIYELYTYADSKVVRFF
ncbi:MAG: hypothetical protein IKF19_01730 [Bacilli bacterium]|nr:hypothetical protein [Bacilli bacterium]